MPARIFSGVAATIGHTRVAESPQSTEAAHEFAGDLGARLQHQQFARERVEDIDCKVTAPGSCGVLERDAAKPDLLE